MTKKPFYDYIVLFIFLSLLCFRPVHAYIDPGSGSFMIQAIIAGILAVSYTFRIYFFKFGQYLKKVFVSTKSKDSTNATPEK